MATLSLYDAVHTPRRQIATATGRLLFCGFVAIATMMTLIFPPVIIFFAAPIIMLGVWFLPKRKCIPAKFIWPLILVVAALMPFWPTYIHLKIGSLPILTPPRIVFYILSAIWIFDMISSRVRRGYFLFGLKKNKLLGGGVICFFALNALSLPMAEGRILASEIFFRQLIILAVPFCIFVTYVRKFKHIRHIAAATAIGAGVAGGIAGIEFLTKSLLAAKLAPFIMTSAQWLEITQELKTRDGIFRAQATHTHPISLGEYLSFTAPLALCFFAAAKRRARILWALILVLIVIGIFATNSRGALMALAAGTCFITAIAFFGRIKQLQGSRFLPLAGLASIFLIAAAPILVAGAQKIANGDSGTSAARSTQGRIDQINMAWPKIVKRPVLGYGAGRSARIVGYYGRALSLDNYYLSLAVELGFPGPLCFLAILIAAIATTLKRASDATLRTIFRAERMVWLGLSGAMFAFLVSRMIISQTGNLNFFFPLIGAIIGANAGTRIRRPGQIALPSR